MTDKPVILDLCGGTGAWSRPWAESGEYDVRVITLPEHDVRTYQPPEEVYGILAAPPCTYFCVMRNCRGKPTKEQLTKGLLVVEACMRIIWKCQPTFWALENPRGTLHRWLGEPQLKFQPSDYGDPWTKGTCIWGNFKKPLKFFPVKSCGMLIPGNMKSLIFKTKDGKYIRGVNRSVTSPGFAKAFFEANRIINRA